MIFNPPSVAASQQEETQHFWIIQSLWSYSKCTTVPADRHTTVIFTLSTSTNTFTSAIFHSSRIVKTSQPAQINRLSCTSHTKPALLRVTRIFQKQLFSCCCPKTKKHTVQHLHFPQIHKKLIISEC